MTRLELREVDAYRGGRCVLRGLDLSVKAGEVHAVLGERRAGKSAIVALLAGALEHRAGTIHVDGRLLDPPSPRETIRAGVGIFFQEPSLIPSLNAPENVLAGRKRIGFGASRELKAAESLILSTAARWQVAMDLRAPSRRLTAIEAAIAELSRALAFDPAVLLFDETAGRFTADELQILYAIVREARRTGQAVVYIASSVDEIFRVADRVSIMKHGRFINTLDVHSLDRDHLVDLAYSFTESREELVMKNVELLKYRRYNEEIVSNLPLGSVILDATGRIYLINLAARMALCSSSFTTAEGELDLDRLLLNIDEPVKSEITRAAHQGEHGEWLRAAASDGRILSLLAFPFHDSAERPLGTILTVEDVTQNVLTQEYLVRAERASSIAQLAAGVAHEVNNPLAIISNYVELLIMRDQEDYTSERLSIIRDEIKRIHGIVVSLLSFAAIGASCLEDVDLSDVARAGLQLLAHEAEMRGILLAGDLPAAPLRARVDPSRLKQIIINLVFNAIEALPEGGHVTLRLRPSSAGELPGEAALLEIEDDGPGIPERVLRSLFEPFVKGEKTKPHAGLGLSVCKHIVEAHGGTILCESAPGRTLFRVSLPLNGPPEPAVRGNGQS